MIVFFLKILLTFYRITVIKSIKYIEKKFSTDINGKQTLLTTIGALVVNILSAS